jgi:hypothetical protein
MTIADIARAAGVPVESVLRVLNHDEVSSDVAARVRDALERYGYGRLAQPSGERSKRGDPDALERVRRQLQGAVEGAATGLEASAVSDMLLRRLVEDVDEIKRELRRVRSERLEDLTLVIDLITTSWSAVDRRLGSIDRKLDRLEGLREPGRGSRLP